MRFTLFGLGFLALSLNAQELTIKEIELAIGAAERTAQKLDTMKNAGQIIAALSILLAIATGLVQILSKPWVKHVTAALAVATTAATLIKQQFFPLDHHTCESAIEEMSPVIYETRAAIEVYRGKDTSADDRHKALAYALARKASLERFSSVFKVTRAGGVPSAFVLNATPAPDIMPVQRQQMRAPISEKQSATAVASSKEAAYQHARYLAAERAARRLTPKADGDSLNRAIQYFATQSLADAHCTKSKSGLDECEITLRIPRDYAQWSVVDYLAPPVRFQKDQVSGAKAVAHTLGSFTVPVSAKSRVDGRFDFQFVREGDQLRLWAIDCGNDGGVANGELWAFEIRLAGETLRLPMNRYYARNRYQVAPTDNRRLTISTKDPAPQLRIEGRRIDD
ncbi:MAG: hypothetical protein SFV18_16985 [Bryobacteraceae bacterium]|nr:hypothetical protein [Bryobacteraceae bacterium]